jgi:hypothetical protein
MIQADYNFKLALERLGKQELALRELTREIHYANQELLTAIMEDRHMADYCLTINKSKLNRYLRSNDMD